MRIEGRLIKNSETGKFWAVEVPALGVHTQGISKKEALEMAKDAVEIAVDHKGFKAIVQSLDDDTFVVTASIKNTRWLISSIIRRKRQEKGLTCLQVANRMGQKSITGYLRYEHGEAQPSMEKFTQIMIAIDPALEPILKIA